MMRKIIIIINFTVFLLAGAVLGAEQTPGYYEYGVGLKRELPVELLNPAFFARFSRPELYLGVGVRVFQEERTKLVFDQFENRVGEAVYADNTTIGTRLGSVAGGFSFGKLGFGGMLIAERDLNYFYQKDYRDDFYVKVGEDRFHQQGLIYSGGFGVGFMPVSFFSLGIGGSYIFGTRSQEQVIIRIPDTSRFETSSRLRGIRWCAGAGVFPARRLQLGLSYQSGARLNDQEGRKVIACPWVSELTARFLAPGPLPAEGQLVLGLSGWSGVDSGFKNVFFGEVVIGHLLLNLVQIDYGFRFEPLPVDPAVQPFTGLFGIGFDLNRYRVNFKIAVSRLELNSDPGAVPFSVEGDRVYQNSVDLGLVIKYQF